MDYLHPSIDPSACVSNDAVVLGDVELGPETVVLACATLRGDMGRRIVVGPRTNIQENACLHLGPNHDTVLGSGVSVGHGAIVHGATVGDNTVVGMGAIVLDGAVVGRDCMVGAGALVTGGKSFPAGSLIIGAPAKAVRSLRPEEIEANRENAEEYLRVGAALVEQGLARRG